MTEALSFLQDWLDHSEYWFDPDHSHDEYLTNQYQQLLEEPWNRNNPDIFYHLEKLIAYDQLARHVYRDSRREIATYLSKALEVYIYIEKHFNPNLFTPIQWCFYCLPIRHSKNARTIFQVIQDTWKRLEKEPDPTQQLHYKRFLKASYERCPMDQTPFIEEHITIHPPGPFPEFFQYLDILEYCPVTPPVVAPALAPAPNPLETAMETLLVQNKIKHILLSLSGGVDSMVCCHLLKRLQPTWGFHFACVYINYDNRSIREYNFVRDWCEYLQVPLYVRHITEIHRAPCRTYELRNTYEDYTKQVRFHTYSAVWKLRGCPGYDYPKVLLGHNQDDCFENILTNLCHKAKYENLRGMREVQHQDHPLTFYRPLLSIPKADIYQYARTNGIPYLVDSTPSWSQRGKIRDSVRPTLEAWNPEMVRSLLSLSDQLTEYEEIVGGMVEHWLHATDQTQTLTLPLTKLLLSKTIWRRYFLTMGFRLKHKALQHFIERIKKNIFEKEEGTFHTTLSKDITVSYRTTQTMASFQFIQKNSQEFVTTPDDLRHESPPIPEVPCEDP